MRIRAQDNMGLKKKPDGQTWDETLDDKSLLQPVIERSEAPTQKEEEGSKQPKFTL